MPKMLRQDSSRPDERSEDPEGAGAGPRRNMMRVSRIMT
jgi:hypothetical protein